MISAKIRAAERLLVNFTGHKQTRQVSVKFPKIPSVVLAVGRVTGIMYSTVRDGKQQNLFHEFAGHAQPLLAVSHDGRNLLLLSGSYNFTARGIVDRRKRRKR